ncbi:MAG: hypothetical protein K0Q73_8447 [Paenibacillus sp.]|jgi:thiol-disulfide isomerase/thioredoxin|nr:hypothetical protein [Paenibacillus sp.]
MLNELNKLELYEKFLKNKTLEVLDVGEYIPNILLQDSDGSSKQLYEFITDHLFIFFFSTECESCMNSMEALHEFSQKSHPVNIMILIHTTEDGLEQIRAAYPPEYKIFTLDKGRIHNELRTYRLPRCLMLNRLGQVLALNSCVDQYWIQKAIKPISALLLSIN